MLTDTDFGEEEVIRMIKLKDFKFKDLKLKSLIVHNLALKIVAVIVAAIIWIVVVNIDNPSQRQPITGITVDILNEELLTDMGYIYEIQSGTNLSISVRAPQSVIEELRSTDFYAYVDFAELDNATETVDIHVNCTNESYANQVKIVSQTLDVMQLAVDNKVEKEVEVTANITGTPAEGYVVGSYSISPTTINITGAETTVSRIARAVLNYDVSSMTASINDYVVPVFYDENGNVISSDGLVLSRSDVQLSIEILPTKWVTVNYVITGEPADGYEVVSTESNLTSVNIAGTRESLDAISSIDIPEGIIDIQDADETQSISVPLTSYLPSGYKIVSAENNLVVTIEIETIVNTNISIPINSIEMTGTNSAFTYEISGAGTSLSVRISGIEAEVDRINAENLKPSISLAGLTAGTHRVAVNLTEGENYSIAGTYYVTVVITAPEEEETTTEQNTTETEEETTATEETTASVE